MSDEDKKESAVEVTLPDESITQVELSDNKASIEEDAPKIRVKDEKDPEPTRIDEREKALQDLKKQYEHQKIGRAHV